MLLSQQPEADIFPVHAGDGGHTDIDGSALVLESNASILWQSAFGNIERGHDLETRGDGILQDADLWWNGGLMEDSVNAVADAKIVPEWLKMNIGCALLQALPQDLIHKLHHRGLGIFAVEDIDLFLLDKRLLLTILKQLFKSFSADTVGRFHSLRETATGGHSEAHRPRMMMGYRLPGGMIKRIPYEQSELVGVVVPVLTGLFMSVVVFGQNLKSKRKTGREA